MNKRPYQLVAEQLKKFLSDEHFQIGDRLPPERSIAEQLTVSRSTVRDAMIMLEIEGLVEVRKGSGIYVSALLDNEPRSEVNQVDSMGTFEMLQARQLVESHIAEFAASQITKNDVVRLRLALDKEKQAILKGEDNELADKAFHLAVAEATQNSALVDVSNQFWTQRENSLSWQTLHKRLTDISYREKWLNEHEAIFAALKSKKPDIARQAMWQHLESVKQTLLTLSDVEDPLFDGYLFESYSLEG
ncbi:FCD domain-containing protein [Catenovulum maritimum]|uniref:Transcriptional regulator n=1 Tax=Catenovulum maritimum TaxID=1513271 RepID=A0A0J8GPX1_9ALTE|nr:FCD domain-containing protein [Catenovulum maritimum]KMT64845.1 transcriptional regulator [Catenovulum maritimum]